MLQRASTARGSRVVDSFCGAVPRACVASAIRVLGKLRGLAVAAQAHRVRGHARCEDPWACRLWNFQGCNWVLRRPAGRSDAPGRIRLVCICCSRISSPDTYCGDIQGASTRSAAANRQGTHPVHRLASAPPARRVRVARPGCCFASEFCETVSRSAAPWSACVMRVRLQHDAPAGPPCSAGFGRPSTVWLVL
jgi:hypothetical protein